MNTPRVFSRAEVAFLIGVPLAWAVLLWFHPSTDPDDIYGSLRDQVVTYQIVHVGTLIFIGLMGVALYMLVRDLPGKAATISRLAIGPFVLLYGAWESVIWTGHRRARPARERCARRRATGRIGRHSEPARQRHRRGIQRRRVRRGAGLGHRGDRRRGSDPPRRRARPGALPQPASRRAVYASAASPGGDQP